MGKSGASNMGKRVENLESGLLTLQKSILLTPLLPRAGPTGGEGDAWPAPTMSLTIWSVVAILRAMTV